MSDGTDHRQNVQIHILRSTSRVYDNSNIPVLQSYGTRVPYRKQGNPFGILP